MLASILAVLLGKVNHCFPFIELNDGHCLGELIETLSPVSTVLCARHSSGAHWLRAASAQYTNALSVSGFLVNSINISGCLNQVSVSVICAAAFQPCVGIWASDY